MKKGIPGWVYILLSIIIVVIFWVLFILFMTVVYNEEEKTDYNETEELESGNIFNKEDTVVYEDIHYTIKNVTRTKGNDYASPAENKEFVIISLLIENKSEEPHIYSYLGWELVTPKVKTDAIMSPINRETTMSINELEPNESKLVSIVFEIPTDEQNLKLNYYENSYLKEDYTFQFLLN